MDWTNTELKLPREGKQVLIWSSHGVGIGHYENMANPRWFMEATGEQVEWVSFWLEISEDSIEEGTENG